MVIKPLADMVGILMTNEAWYAFLSFIMFAWALLWLSVVQDSPRNHTWMTSGEVMYITEKQELQGYYQTIMVIQI